MRALILGGSREQRTRAALARQEALGCATVLAVEASTLPFVPPDRVTLQAADPRVVRIDDIDLAFPSQQVAGVRLVLTQSMYVMQKWIDALPAADHVIATADRAALASGAREALEGRGPWRVFEVIDIGTDLPRQTDDRPSGSAAMPSGPPTVEHMLVRAFQSTSPEERLRLCLDAVAAAPGSPVAAIALASTCRERGCLADARIAIDRALRLAPRWEAAHFEDGKLWLACDEMERACEAFERACDLMETFSAAFSNLGAARGELGRREGALAAFEQALATDPGAFLVWNNIGVVHRELGRLEESEAALRRVVDLAPAFVFGHYNLGHTLFLQRRYGEALAAYEEGQRRDPAKNRRQGCRLAMVRFATGDEEGAERDLRHWVASAPAEARADLLAEACGIASALVQGEPEVAGRQAFLGRLERMCADLGPQGA